MALALPSLSILAIGGALLAGTAAYGLYQRSEKVEARAEAEKWKAADAVNQATIRQVRLDAVNDRLRVGELENNLTALRERQRARTDSIAMAEESNTCGPAMRALFDSLRRDADGTDDAPVPSTGSPR